MDVKGQLKTDLTNLKGQLGRELYAQLMQDLKRAVFDEVKETLRADLTGGLLQEMKTTLLDDMRGLLSEELKASVLGEVRGACATLEAQVMAGVKTCVQGEVAELPQTTVSNGSDLKALEDRVGMMDGSREGLISDLFDKVDKLGDDVASWDAWWGGQYPH